MFCKPNQSAVPIDRVRRLQRIQPRAIILNLKELRTKNSVSARQTSEGGAIMDSKIPESLKLEHEELHAELARARETKH